jgi:hypothetical protein
VAQHKDKKKKHDKQAAPARGPAEPAQAKPHHGDDRTWESGKNDDPGSAPESGDKEP